MQKHILTIKNKVFITSLVIILSFSCARKNEDSNASNHSLKDSIDAWVSQSRNTDYSYKKRALLLNKAYQKTNAIIDDSTKTKHFAKLSLASLRLNDSVLFREINFKALLYSYKTKDSTRLAEAHWDLASFFNKYAIKDSSYYNFNEAQKIYLGLNDNLTQARMLINMGNIQSNIGDYTGSEITIIKAIELLKPLNEHTRLYNCYNILGNNAASIKEHSRAIEYHNKALYYLEESNEKNVLSKQTTNNNIAVVYQKQGQPKKAITYLKQVISHDSLYDKSPRLYARALNNLAYNKYEINDTRELPNLFFRAYDIFDSINYLSGKSGASYNLAQYYLKEGDSTKALVNAKKAQNFAQQINDNERVLETLRLLSKIDLPNTTIYTQQYLNLNDSLQQQERKIRDKFARIRFETDEINAENKLINAENELLAKQKQLWLVIAVIILLVAGSIFIILNQRTKNRILKFEQKQQASNEEIFNLLLAQKKNIEEGKQIEQKRISEELHDGVLGKMLGARMMLLGLNKKTDPEAISERAKAISTLQSIEGEVRSISHELSHAAYQKINNFILSIKDLLEDIENSSKININFKFSETLDYDILNGDIKINLYRVIQEILQNSVKHSGCSHININFMADIEVLKVSIIDNGKGFTVKKEKKGIGMRNIASRIEKVNGIFSINSKIGEGTTIDLQIPIISNKNDTISNKVIVDDYLLEK